MAGPTVTLAFAGDSTKLDKTFRDVGSSADRMADDVGDSSKRMGRDMDKGLDRVRDSADNSERRIMGFRDALTGTGDVMKGLRDGDMLTFAMGLGDLASAVANLGVDVAKATVKIVKSYATQAAAAVKASAKTVAQIGLQIGRWVALGVQSTIQAAKVAAAWIVAMGPIAWVGAAVVALVALFVTHWDEIKEVVGKAVEWITDKFDDLVSWFGELPGKITGALGDLGGLLRSAGEKLLDGMLAGVSWYWENVLKRFWIDLPTATLGAIGDAATWLVQKGKDVVTGLFAGIYETVLGVWGWFGGLKDTILTALGNAREWLVETGKDIMRGLADGIAQAAVSIPNTIAEKTGLPVRAVVGFGGGGRPEGEPLLRDPGRALGGMVKAGRSYRVGEHGEERFVPSTDGAIIPHHRLGTGGGTTVINVLNPQVRSDDDLRRLETMLTKLRRQGSRAVG